VLYVLGAVILIALYLVSVYNRLVVFRNRIDNAWSQIDVQLRRRYDLIPNLVETVKGYATHEREVLERVTQARASAIAANNVRDQGQAENLLTQALRSVFAVAENYPQLRASENFQQLQEELSGTESKIAFARQFYNDTVLRYNNARQSFPSVLVASSFGFGEREYFEMEEEEARKPVAVKFS
jgi:LemA protein